ncbi:hypothetical protein WJX73_003264 [Symbiochloris irregularis]|uniref:Mitochondrial import inner membrane translocase subunit tim16 n=1 Tax=Symbiochloris irregularis TaxID=706552 RepID=A0AAW1PFS5_9CHLO
MAGRILANVIVAGASILIRAGVQAYRQAIVNGARAGVKAEGPIASKATQLSLQEARAILGVEKDAPLEEVLKRYNHLFDANEKSGSFYLQSKVYRAKEALEAEMKASGKP